MAFTVKPTEDIINDIIIEVVGNVPEITDVNPGSVLRQLIEGVGIELGTLYDDLNTIFEGTRVLTSTGDDLENLGSIVGITRKEGIKATAFVTFSRLQPIGANFVIPAGAIISTQPNTGEEQLRYLVLADTTFSASISGESHKYVDGIFRYPLDQRLISSVSDLDGTASAAPYTFAEGTDFSIEKDVDTTVVDADTITLIDDCDTADFTESADATADAVDAVNQRQGTGCLDLGKSGAVSIEASYEKVLGGVVDAADKDLLLWIYMKDQATIDKLNELIISVGSGGSLANSLSYDIKTELAVGWKLYSISLTDADIVRTGLINLAAVNFIRFDMQTNAVGNLITSGDVKMDFWFFADSRRYEGDTITWDITGTRPDDGTNFNVDYVPLSVEVNVEAEDVGTNYNVGRHKIIFKVSTVANVDNVDNYRVVEGGTDTETDEELRLRIQNAADVAGNATVNALQQAVLAVEGVTSVSVSDLPQKSQTDEPHIFHTGVDDYKCNFELALNNANFIISDTQGGPANYTNGTDYIVSDSQVIWQAAGSKPANLATFYLNYDYEWLGHVEMFISGTTTPLPVTITNNIQTAIDETRAAGIAVTFQEPTVIAINVDIKIKADTDAGYTFAGIKDNVEEALRTYINLLDVGEDILIAELYRISQDVEGVANSSITTPAADVSVASTEIAKAGTINVTAL